MLLDNSACVTYWGRTLTVLLIQTEVKTHSVLLGRTEVETHSVLLRRTEVVRQLMNILCASEWSVSGSSLSVMLIKSLTSNRDTHAIFGELLRNTLGISG